MAAALMLAGFLKRRFEVTIATQPAATRNVAGGWEGAKVFEIDPPALRVPGADDEARLDDLLALTATPSRTQRARLG